MKRIAILTCSNVTQDLACASFQCLRSLYQKKDRFAHPGQENIELAGVINCAGCPTAIAPEKLFNRVRSLAVLHVDAIHLSTCLVHLCPFKKKYMNLLALKYPEIKVVEGTHGAPEGMPEDQFASSLKAMMRGLLTQPQKTMGDIVR